MEMEDSRFPPFHRTRQPNEHKPIEIILPANVESEPSSPTGYHTSDFPTDPASVAPTVLDESSDGGVRTVELDEHGRRVRRIRALVHVIGTIKLLRDTGIEETFRYVVRCLFGLAVANGLRLLPLGSPRRRHTLGLDILASLIFTPSHTPHSHTSHTPTLSHSHALAPFGRGFHFAHEAGHADLIMGDDELVMMDSDLSSLEEENEHDEVLRMARRLIRPEFVPGLT